MKDDTTLTQYIFEKNYAVGKTGATNLITYQMTMTLFVSQMVPDV